VSSNKTKSKPGSAKKPARPKAQASAAKRTPAKASARTKDSRPSSASAKKPEAAQPKGVVAKLFRALVGGREAPAAAKKTVPTNT
jgi:hypothetical protein